MEQTSPRSTAQIVSGVTESVRHIMSQPPFDTSHDFSHIERVVSLAETLGAAERALHPMVQLDPLLITLTALLHDVGDHKYSASQSIDSSQSSHMEVETAESILLIHSASPALAETVQKLVSHVSCTYEQAHPSAVAELLTQYPELAIVQDADRLDAIGAVGIGRALTFGGAHGRTLAQTRQIFENKLLMRESLMKTTEGKRLAHERCNRLREFMGWWAGELV